MAPKKTKSKKTSKETKREVEFRAPVAISVTRVAQPSSVVVRHSEPVATFEANANGIVGAVKYYVNPGKVDTFPWLCNIARCYEYYRFKRLMYKYVPLIGTTATGRVCMAFDGDPHDTYPANMDAMESYEAAVSFQPWARAQMHVPSGILSRYQKFYCRYNLDATDVRVTDVGCFYFAADGCPDNVAIGRVYVDYEVEFFTPQIPTSDEESDHYVASSAAPAGNLLLNPLKDASVVLQTTGFSSIDTTGALLELLEAGSYLAVLSASGDWSSANLVSDWVASNANDVAVTATGTKFDTTGLISYVLFNVLRKGAKSTRKGAEVAPMVAPTLSGTIPTGLDMRLVVSAVNAMSYV